MSAYFKENGQLIEIPFGTRGPQGPQGPKGDKGDPGEGGSSIAKDISYDNDISGIPAENVQDVIDVLSKGDDKGGSCNYILHVDPSSSSIVDDCMIHVQQLFNEIVVDEFNGTLTEIGAHYFQGFNDAGKWHDLAFNGSAGSYLTIYANKDGLVYNGNAYNTGAAIREFYRSDSFDGTFTNGSHVAVITDGSDYISYGNKTVKKELDKVNNSIDILNSDDTVVGSVDNKIKVAVGDISGFDQEFVDVLPETGKKGVIYFVPKEGGEDPDICDEYIWVGDRFELVGNTGVSINPIREVDLETWESMTDEQRKNGVYYVKRLTSGVTALEVNKRVDELDENLTTNDGLKFMFGREDGKLGLYTDESKGADSFVPFSSYGKVDISGSYTVASGSSSSYTIDCLPFPYAKGTDYDISSSRFVANRDMVIDAKLGANSASSSGKDNFYTKLYVNGVEKANAYRGLEAWNYTTTRISLKKGDIVTCKIICTNLSYNKYMNVQLTEVK